MITLRITFCSQHSYWVNSKIKTLSQDILNILLEEEGDNDKGIEM